MNDPRAEDRAASAGPGWYPHPNANGGLRYWDGQVWTDHFAAAPSAPAQPQRDNSALIGWGIATGLLMPLIGFILGIVLLTRNDKWGIWITIGSIGSAIFWAMQLAPDSPSTYGY